MSENLPVVIVTNPRQGSRGSIVRIVMLLGALASILTIPFLAREKSVGSRHTLWARYSASVSTMLAVDPRLPYADQVKEGNYAVCNDDVWFNRVSSRNDRYVAKAVLLQLDGPATTDEVVADMKNNHLHPANIFDLLAFGAKQIDIGDDYNVVELGTAYRGADGDDHYAAVGSAKGQRRLASDKVWSDKTWPSKTFFLAIQDPESQDHFGFKM